MDVNHDSPSFDQPAFVSLSENDMSPPLPDFELHYDFDSRYSVMHILDSIVQDLSSHGAVHNWEEKLLDDPVKDMAKSASQELIRLDFYNCSYVLTYSAVGEVSTLNGVNHRHHTPERYLPSIEVGSSAS